jgi:hypothetical protein
MDRFPLNYSFFVTTTIFAQTFRTNEDRPPERPFNNSSSQLISLPSSRTPTDHGTRRSDGPPSTDATPPESSAVKASLCSTSPHSRLKNLGRGVSRHKFSTICRSRGLSGHCLRAYERLSWCDISMVMDLSCQAFGRPIGAHRDQRRRMKIDDAICTWDFSVVLRRTRNGWKTDTFSKFE